MSEIKFNGSTFDDVTLEVSQIFMNEVVETKKYKASKAILALKSETFRTMLSNPLGNPNNGDFFPIKVTSSLENFEHFCRFLYGENEKLVRKTVYVDGRSVRIVNLEAETEIVCLLCQYICVNKLETRLRMLFGDGEHMNVGHDGISDDREKLIFVSDLMNIAGQFSPDIFRLLKRLVSSLFRQHGADSMTLDMMTYFSSEMVEFIVDEKFFNNEIRDTIKLVCALYDRVFIKSDEGDFGEYSKLVNQITLPTRDIQCLARYLNLEEGISKTLNISTYRKNLLDNLFRDVMPTETRTRDVWFKDYIGVGFIREGDVKCSIRRSKDNKSGLEIEVEIEVCEAEEKFLNVRALNVVVLVSGISQFRPKRMPILRRNGAVANCKFTIPFKPGDYDEEADDSYVFSLKIYQGSYDLTAQLKLRIPSNQVKHAKEMPIENKIEKPIKLVAKRKMEEDTSLEEVCKKAKTCEDEPSESEEDSSSSDSEEDD